MIFKFVLAVFGNTLKVHTLQNIETVELRIVLELCLICIDNIWMSMHALCVANRLTTSAQSVQGTISLSVCSLFAGRTYCR